MIRTAIIKPEQNTLMMIDVAKCSRTLAQEKSFTGADWLINGGLYDTHYKNKPNLWLRSNGRTLHQDKDGYWCLGFDRNNPKVVHSRDIGTVKNAICCCTMVYNSRMVPKLNYDPGQGGYRARTGIGITRDNSLFMVCTTEGSHDSWTPEQMMVWADKQNLNFFMMLDSGGSTQCDFRGIRQSTGRKVHNWICVFTPKDWNGCPWVLPSTYTQSGTQGQPAFWTQWYLSRKGFSTALDGKFGSQSVKALKSFQRSVGIKDDGVCGPMTRQKLMEA